MGGRGERGGAGVCRCIAICLQEFSTDELVHRIIQTTKDGDADPVVTLFRSNDICDKDTSDSMTRS